MWIPNTRGMQESGLEGKHLKDYGLGIADTRLPELWSVSLVQNADYRGSYMTFCHNELFQQITGEHIAEGNLVENHSGTFRGFHFSPHSWKLYLCLKGTLHYYVVNWDKTHKDYGEWQQITLLPYYGFIKHPRYATGMWSIGESTLLVLQSQYYDAQKPDQITISKEQVNDELRQAEKRQIFYPELPMVMSERDTIGEYL